MAGWRVAVIGAGTMGRGIAYYLASQGVEVVVYDLDSRAAEAAVGYAGRAGRVEKAPSLPAAVGSVDLVFEAIVEDLQAKRSLYKEIHEAMPRLTIASTTSTFTAKRLSEGLPGSDAILVAHWVNPPEVMPIVEIATAPWTGKAHQEKVENLLVEVGKHPVRVPDIPGFVVNRLNAALYREALKLVFQHGVDPSVIDEIARYHLGPILSVSGVFETIDHIGLDTLLRSAASLQEAIPSSPGDEVILERLLAMAGEGRLGVKTGKGFYTYPGSPEHHREARARKLRGVLECLEDTR